MLYFIDHFNILYGKTLSINYNLISNYFLYIPSSIFDYRFLWSLCCVWQLVTFLNLLIYIFYFIDRQPCVLFCIAFSLCIYLDFYRWICEKAMNHNHEKKSKRKHIQKRRWTNKTNSEIEEKRFFLVCRCSLLYCSVEHKHIQYLYVYFICTSRKYALT